MDSTSLGTDVAGRVVHVAPEEALARPLRGRAKAYVTVDLLRDDVDVRVDLTAIGLRSGIADLVLCSHVLEHVPDDRAAMAELGRVLADDGVLVVAVPLDDGGRTVEDPGGTSPADRARLFGQSDHVRAYGDDIADRLRDAGLDVSRRDLVEGLGPEVRRRHGLMEREIAFLCRRTA